MKLLITGATGFVGCTVTESACEAGHDVTALVRNISDMLPEQVSQVAVGDFADLDRLDECIVGSRLRGNDNIRNGNDNIRNGNDGVVYSNDSNIVISSEAEKSQSASTQVDMTEECHPEQSRGISEDASTEVDMTEERHSERSRGISEDASTEVGMTEECHSERSRGISEDASINVGMTVDEHIERLISAMEDIDVVIHTAARAHVMHEKHSDPAEIYRQINVTFTERLAAVAAKAGVKRFVFLSSIKVNGESTTPIPTFPHQGGRSNSSILSSNKEGMSNSSPISSNKEGMSNSSPISSNKEGMSNSSPIFSNKEGMSNSSILSSNKEGMSNSSPISSNKEERNNSSASTPNRGPSSTPSPQGGEGWGEGAGKPFTETDIPNPQDLYAISKWQAEQTLIEIGQRTGMEIVILRPPMIYGPGVKGNFANLLKLVNKGIPLPLGNVKNKRSLLALDNLVSAILMAAKHPAAANQTFLVADDEAVSTTQLIRYIATAQGKKARLIPMPVSLMTFAAKVLGKQSVADRLFGSLQIDTTKIQKQLGWRPVVTMQQQLEKMFPDLDGGFPPARE